MNLKTNQKENVRLKKVSLVLLTFVGMYLITFLVFPQSDWNQTKNLSVSKITFDVISTLLLSICITELSLFIDKKMNLFFPWTKYAMRRLLMQTLVQIVLVAALIGLFTTGVYLTLLLFNMLPAANDSVQNEVWQFIAAIIFLALIIGSLNTVNYLVAQWKEAVVKAAEYKVKAAEAKQLAAETELQALRLQLDPHFVFNNLSVLSELILKDQQLGFEYTENFAKVYRYLLLNAKKKLISLQEELKFLEAYLFLLKNRMGSGFNCEIDIPKSKLDFKIPPVTLQLLVENAIKHNRIEKENPLLIKILVNETNKLIVTNNILPLMKPAHSSGVGLENISKRFDLLSDKKPTIEKSQYSFTVKIPLLS